MSGIREKGGGGKTALVLCLALAGAGCSSTTLTQPQPVVHIVLLWLKHPGFAADRAQLIRAAHSLRMMPGVVRVDAGRTLPRPATETDRSFDLGVAITFRDRAALQRYERDPRQAEAMARYLRPLVRRSVTYNLGVR